MYQEGLHSPEEDEPTRVSASDVVINIDEQVLQSPYVPFVEGQEIINTLKGRKINMDSRDIAQVVSDLNELLSDSERIQEEAATKVDELTDIKDELEEANSSLTEAVEALEGLADIVDKVEGLLSDADNAGIN